MRFRARIRVTGRPGVLDPQGKAVEEALGRLGLGPVGNVQVGKWIELDIEADQRADAERTIDDMCGRLLAHPVTEQYVFTVYEPQSEGDLR